MAEIRLLLRCESNTDSVQWAWNAFVAINSTTQVGSGYSSITDVNAPGGGNFTNFQESFLFAEVLKYRQVAAGRPYHVHAYADLTSFQLPHPRTEQCLAGKPQRRE